MLSYMKSISYRNATTRLPMTITGTSDLSSGISHMKPKLSEASSIERTLGNAERLPKPECSGVTYRPASDSREPDMFKCYPHPNGPGQTVAENFQGLWNSIQRTNAALQVILDAREGGGDNWLDYNSEFAGVLRKDLRAAVQLLREREPAGTFRYYTGGISAPLLTSALGKIAAWLEYPDDFPKKTIESAQQMLRSFPGTPSLALFTGGDDTLQSIRLSKSLTLYLGFRQPGSVLGGESREQILEQLSNTMDELDFAETDLDNPRPLKDARAALRYVQSEIKTNHSVSFMCGLNAALALGRVEAALARNNNHEL